MEGVKNLKSAQNLYTLIIANNVKKSGNIGKYMMITRDSESDCVKALFCLELRRV